MNPAVPSLPLPPAPSSGILIRASGLTVARRGQVVLRDVDLTVAAGEIVTLVGPNGAGKSSLIQALLGLLPPVSGTVTRRAGLRLGYMPQRLSIDATLPLTVRRLLTLWGRGTADDLAAVVARTGVAPLLHRGVQGLSGGEWQRVLLARALLRHPDLLVLDEPAQALDRGGQDNLYRLIDAVRRDQGCGVLMVSHDLGPVLRLSDRVVHVEGGIRVAGPPTEVARHPDFIALFGAPAEDGVSRLAGGAHHG